MPDISVKDAGGATQAVRLPPPLGPSAKGAAIPVTIATDDPMLVATLRRTVASGVTPLAATLSAGTSTLGPFTPALDRPMMFTRSGGGAGSTQILRSIDGGTIKLPLSLGGATWALFTADAQEIVWEECEAAATFYVSASGISGIVNVRLAQ